MGQVRVWGRPRKTNKNSEFPACEEPPAKVCPFKSLLGLISKSFLRDPLSKVITQIPVKDSATRQNHRVKW